MSIILGAALLPPLFLMWKVYQNDTIEKEPTGLLVRIFIFGMISVFVVSKFLKKHSFTPIVIYRIIFGISVWFL